MEVVAAEEKVCLIVASSSGKGKASLSSLLELLVVEPGTVEACTANEDPKSSA